MVPDEHFLAYATTVPYGDSFLLVGGQESGPNGPHLATIYEFDAENWEWIEREERLERPRDGHVAFFVDDDMLGC